MQKSNIRQTLKYYFQHAKNHKWWAIATFVIIPFGILLNTVAFPYVIKQIIDLLTGFEGVDKLIVWSELSFWFWTFVGVYGLVFIVWRLFDCAIIEFQCRVLRDLDRTVYKKLQQHSFDFFANHFVGALVNKARRFTRSFEVVADKIIFDVWGNFIRLSGSIGVLFFVAPTLAFVLLGWTVIFFIINFAFTSFLLRYGIEDSAADSRLTGELADTVGNVSAMKTFARESYERLRFKDVTEDRFRRRRVLWHWNTVGRVLQTLLMATLEITFLWFMLQFWMADNLTVGEIVMIQLFLNTIIRSLWDIGRILQELYRAFAESEEMTQILLLEPEIKDRKKTIECVTSRGKIEFQKIDFAYEKNSDPIFKNFNLKIKAGEKIGLVGESGAGKSTITKLLLRFSDVNAGKILIDGQDIRDLKQECLRSHIAYVPQDPMLFHRTLLENIQYGDLEADAETIQAVAKQANAHDFILKCSQGYETLVGERGIKLSGGERQRVAIARAMLKNAPILILDEATSSLDSKSESLIQQALERLMKNRTAIVIAHRLSTIQKMDRILVLDQGKVVEQGTHKELLAKKGKYAELWAHQSE